MEQKKARKLFEHMYGGGDNGGVDYGHEIMFNKGVHKKTRPDRNPLRKGTPFAKAVVIKTVIKKPKKPNSANRKVRPNYIDFYVSLLLRFVVVCAGEAVVRKRNNVFRAQGRA